MAGRIPADDDRQRADDLCAGPAAVVRTRDRIRRPQQRRLFHQMVSGIPAGKIRPARRRTIPFLISPVEINDTQGSPTMQDGFTTLATEPFSTIAFPTL